MAVTAPVTAGEDVTLYDKTGKSLKPTQIEAVDYLTTCGGCHEVAEKAANVHFNRNIDPQDRNSGDCLDCHLSKSSEVFTPNGNIKQVLLRPINIACKTCHDEVPLASGAHSGMDCYGCHQGAGHRAERSLTCAGCHNGKSKAPKPAHRGFTPLHIEKIACETCHAGLSVNAGTSYAIREGKLSAFDENRPSAHRIPRASRALGANGCVECHSQSSAFFPGTIRGGNPLELTQNELLVGDLRERAVKPHSKWLILLILALSICHYALFGPRRVKTLRGEPTILRFTIYERLVHWLTTASFTFLAITGTAFMLHLETPSATWRAIHGQVGGIFTLALLGMLTIWWKTARFTSCDLHWLRRLGGYFWLRGSCPAEKFNAGQKLFFWLFAFCAGIGVCATGLVLLHAKGSAGSWAFTLHDIAAAIIIPGIIGHLYLSVFANPGSLQGILSGCVTKSWAQHHHPNWFQHSAPAPQPSEHTHSTLF